jgi:hypothetical protein
VESLPVVKDLKALFWFDEKFDDAAFVDEFDWLQLLA